MKSVKTASQSVDFVLHLCSEGFYCGYSTCRQPGTRCWSPLWRTAGNHRYRNTWLAFPRNNQRPALLHSREPRVRRRIRLRKDTLMRSTSKLQTRNIKGHSRHDLFHAFSFQRSLRRMFGRLYVHGSKVSHFKFFLKILKGNINTITIDKRCVVQW